MRSHDLTGSVFQRLIVDRKFLAAYYTTPAAAAMLIGLAITPDKKWVYVANAGDNSVTVIRILAGAWAGFTAAVDSSARCDRQLEDERLGQNSVRISRRLILRMS